MAAAVAFPAAASAVAAVADGNFGLVSAPKTEIRNLGWLKGLAAEREK